ncbi:MAG: hypothetical protein KAI33_10610, partial [Elusimicrobiales bacterium]|nr:hypothetical protein [Elusimicrobiales bacterium]
DGTIVNADLNGSITDNKLNQITTANKVADSALTANVILADNNQTITGIKTFTSSITVTGNAFSVGGSTLIAKYGNIGIGDTTPDYKLDVAGTMGIDENLTMTGSAANIVLGSNYLSGDGGDEGIFVNASGNVGIRTNNPGATLHISGGGSLKVSAVDNPWEPSITLATTNDVWKIYRIGSYLAFRNVYDYGSGVSDRLVIKGTGEVGIGDSTPDYKLDVAGTMGIDGNLTMTGSAANIILGSNYLSGDGGDEGIFVDASGNVGIGTTGPGQKLTVAGTIESTSGGIKFPDATTQVTSGKVINTYFVMTAATRQTIASTTPQIITGLSVTLTPVSTNSKFMILAVVNGNLNYVSSVLIYQGGTKLLSHTGNTNEAGAQATRYTSDGNNGGYISQMIINYVDSPATTSSITYDVRMTSGWSGTSYTSYANDRADNDMRTPSTLMIMEIAE